MNDMPVTLLAADYLARLGVSVLRMKPNRDKRPDGEWKEFQSRRLTPEEVAERFADGPPLGVVTGAISGNLVMAEVEGRAQHQVIQVRDLAHDSGLGELWDKVDQGWKEISPSGGVHWFFRQESAPAGNRKLARRPSTPEELAEWKELENVKAQNMASPGREKRLEKVAAATVNDVVQVLAETRGEGGFVVVAPTPGHFHKSGNAWRMARNCAPAKAPLLTDDEAEQFLALLATLDVPVPGRETRHDTPTPQRTPPTPGSSTRGVSPGDDYERVPWEEILTPHGWSKAFEDSAGVKYWTRPGKSHGISASTGRDPERDRLYVFTTSTSFDSEVPYTKFGAYAHLNHGDDYRAAASELRKNGFGRDPELVVASTPPRIEAPPVARTRQDDYQAPGREAPGHAEGSSAAPALAPVVNIKSRQKPDTYTIPQFTEEANAQRFVRDYGSIVRYESASKRWFVWEEAMCRWVRQEDGETGGKVLQLLRQMVADMPTENEGERAWRKKSMSWANYRNTLKLSQAAPGVGVTATAFDRRSWELNTPAGPVDLHTGKLLPATPDKMHSRSTMVAPDMEADQTAWLEFLEQTFPNNPALTTYLQRMAGATLVGEVREHLLIFGYGTGGNGKGVFMEVMGTLLGNYKVAANGEFLMKKHNEKHPEEIARLNGARMFIISEIDPQARFDQAKANLLSGGDAISARFMNSNTFEFQPTHQIWITGNHLPKVVGHGEEGFWRRLRLVPFLHKVPDDKIDPGLKRRLIEDHGPAVLAWMVQGAVEYSKHGLGSAPMDVLAASKSYREEADTVQGFLEDECYVTPEEERDETLTTNDIPAIHVSTFYERYERWCRDNKETALGKRQVARALESKGIQSNPNRRVNGRTPYLWVELLEKTSAFTPPPGNDYSPGAAKE